MPKTGYIHKQAYAKITFMAMDVSNDEDFQDTISHCSLSDRDDTEKILSRAQEEGPFASLSQSRETGSDDDDSNDACETDSDSSDEEDIRIFSRRLPRKSPGETITSPPKDAAHGSRAEEERAEAGLSQKLKELESLTEIRRSYPPRFSSASNKIANSPEAVILEQVVTADSQPVAGDVNAGSTTAFWEVDVEQFCVYQSTRRAKRRVYQGLEGRYSHLHHVSSNVGFNDWLIDGTLNNNGNRQTFLRGQIVDMKFLRGQIVDVNIGGLEDLSQHTTSGSVWIKTVEGDKRDYWYRLTSPSVEYRPYWTDFTWLADFVKFFIDFLFSNSSGGRLVSLADFKSNFWAWLQDLHGSDKMRGWHAQCSEITDFRQHVLSYALFLQYQTYSLQRDFDDPRFSHPVWNEIGAGYYSQDRQASSKDEKTVVTANVAASFLKPFPHWGSKYDLLEIVEKCPVVESKVEDRRRDWHFPNKFHYNQQNNFRGQISKAAWLLEEADTKNRSTVTQASRQLLRKIVIVRVPRKARREYDLRYAWVRAVSTSTIDVVWLLLPADTTCRTSDEGAHYPIGNELFFSDECNCDPVQIRHVVRALEASVFMDHADGQAELFVNSLYRHGKEVHITANESDLICFCRPRRRQPKLLAPEHSPEAQRSTPPKMKVCSLCSGAGLLDLAFCATGRSETVLAVEHNEMAACSHRANNPNKNCKYFFDSVNKILKGHMTGEALIGPFDCLVAGCPCQGFSRLNTTISNAKKGIDDRRNQKNCSLLANMLSWIEVMLPALVLIENVPGMAATPAAGQAICVLVALGYQVKKTIKVDCEVGGGSIRKRLFLIAAAPGLPLPDDVPETHGEELAKLRTAGEIISDLKPIQNDAAVNFEDPNHIPVKEMRIKFDERKGKEISLRRLITRISTSLSDAYYTRPGHLSPLERLFFKNLSPYQQTPKSKCLKRIDAKRPFRTIVTSINPLDARFGGECVHPTKHRLLSLREVCRAMGLPDSFLLAGTIAQKHAQVGNGVPWAMGAGWGLQFAASWSKYWDGRREPPSRGAELVEQGSSASFTAQTISREDARDHRTVQRHPNIGSPSGTVMTGRRRPTRVIPDDSDSGTDMDEPSPPLAPRGPAPVVTTKRPTRVIPNDSDSCDDSEYSRDKKIALSRFSSITVDSRSSTLSDTTPSKTQKTVSQTPSSQRHHEIIDLTADSETDEDTIVVLRTCPAPTRTATVQGRIDTDTRDSIGRKKIGRRSKRKAPEGPSDINNFGSMTRVNGERFNQTNKKGRRE